MNKRRLALIVLMLAPIFGGQAGTLAKLAFRQFTPWTVVFLRHLIAFCILFPILRMRHQTNIKKNDIPLVLAVSLLWCGNVILFTFGIQYTTVILSQILYFFSPLLVILLSRILYKQQFALSQYAGIVLGIIGGVLIFVEAFTGNSSELISSIGTIKGNSLILMAVCSWSLYLVFSKKVMKTYSILVITTYSVLAAAVMSMPFLLHDFMIGKLPLAPVGFDGIVGIGGQAVILSVLVILAYQYAVKYVSPFAASSIIYIGPLSAALTAVPLFGETISAHLLLSGIMIAVGVYFASIRPHMSVVHKISKVIKKKRR